MESYEMPRLCFDVNGKPDIHWFAPQVFDENIGRVTTCRQWQETIETMCQCALEAGPPDPTYLRIEIGNRQLIIYTQTGEQVPAEIKGKWRIRLQRSLESRLFRLHRISDDVWAPARGHVLARTIDEAATVFQEGENRSELFQLPLHGPYRFPV